MADKRQRSIALASLAVALVMAGIYWTFWAKSNVEGEVSDSRLQEYAVGAMQNFAVFDEFAPVPAISFRDEAGNEKSLADWKGKVLLVNLWATWCGPCRHEMPSLDRLQADMGGDRFEVLAISLDRGGLDLPQKFYAENGIEQLALLIDETARAGVALSAFGMPTSVLVDAEGQLVGRLVGPAEWDHADAKALIAALIDQ